MNPKSSQPRPNFFPPLPPPYPKGKQTCANTPPFGVQFFQQRTQARDPIGLVEQMPPKFFKLVEAQIRTRGIFLREILFPKSDLLLKSGKVGRATAFKPRGKIG